MRQLELALDLLNSLEASSEPTDGQSPFRTTFKTIQISSFQGFVGAGFRQNS